MSAMARNLGLVMRVLFGIGTARSLQGEGGFADALYFALLDALTIIERLLMPTTHPNKQKPNATAPFAVAA